MAHLTAMEGIGKESAAQFLKKREEIISDIINRPNGMILKEPCPRYHCQPAGKRVQKTAPHPCSPCR